ncbi:MAG: cbb3-type cytochrome c oxidase subunit 3 [Pseudomonadota bacterium]
MEHSLYNFLRHMADSWGLLYMVVLFVSVIVFTFRPGSRKIADDVAQIPFREDQ